MKIEKLGLNGFKFGIFPLQPTQGTDNPSMSALVAEVFSLLCPNILIPKQMLQRLTTPLTQVKSGNSSENLLIEIRQVMKWYILYTEQKKLLRKYVTI